MLKSMTGYGQSSGQQNGYSVTIELRTLNSKFLDAQVKLPRSFQDKELELRNVLNKRLIRGKASISIELVNDSGALNGQTVNEQLFKAYYSEFERLAEDTGADKRDLFRLALHSPDVLNGGQADDDFLKEQWGFILAHLDKALEACDEFRSQEGASLEKELSQYIQNIGNNLGEIKVLEPERVKVIRDRIQGHQEEISRSDEFDRNRFEQEMIYYIEKLDISEEIVRLTNHLSYFLEVLADKESQGKKLGFVSQEIGREINTIGSKANYAPVQKLVVGMKDELEKIKEQLLNVL
ncbi:YicC/YloC family endoribonuclease [Roseivirga pacifica]|uniref:YicC/YloC family endoribonuclease n=1 Tax=Roseivirga pacifica TaxID=1267423 RepID=UPI003BAAB57E